MKKDIRQLKRENPELRENYREYLRRIIEGDSSTDITEIQDFDTYFILTSLPNQP